MKLVQCKNGHYYDSSKFTDCPYCSNAVKSPGYTVPLGQAAPQPVAEMAAPPTENAALAQEAPVMENTASVQDIPVMENTASAQEAPMMENAGFSQASGMPQMQKISDQWRPQTNPADFWQAGEDDNKTVSYYSRTIGTEPVVGYLIAIGGAYFGEGFRLKTGRNFIGRSPEMDIQLSQDFSISRRKHAVVIYEPKSRIFIAQPGESRELFYLNDEVVLNNVVMKPYDILTIGETKLLLLPLCGEKFSWEDLKK